MFYGRDPGTLNPYALGTDQTEPGFLFISTEFDKGLTTLKGSIQAANMDSATREIAAANAKRFLTAYVGIAKKTGRAYQKGELSLWQDNLKGEGVPAAVIIVLLGLLRTLREAGKISDAVYNPSAWEASHPEHAGIIDSFLTAAVGPLKTVYWYALLAVGVLVFAYGMPGGIAKFVSSKTPGGPRAK